MNDQLLQGTPFGAAALALRQRGGQLDSAMGDPAAAAGPAMQPAPQQGGMSQPQFSGYGSQPTTAQRMEQQKKLMMLLRMRQQPQQGMGAGY